MKRCACGGLRVQRHIIYVEMFRREERNRRDAGEGNGLILCNKVKNERELSPISLDRTQ